MSASHPVKPVRSTKLDLAVDHDDNGSTVGFDVVVEQTIGRVTLGENGHQSPFKAALAVIADHADRERMSATSLDPRMLAYSFPGEGDHERVEVVIRHESQTR